jgi:hypothetical protein
MFYLDLFAFRRAEMNKIFFRLFSISRPFPHIQKHFFRRLNMKSLITFLTVALYLVCLSFQPAFAGAPPLQWQKTFGGNGNDSGYSVQQTLDGGYIITGDTSSFGTGDTDVYLIKTEPNGNSQWQKTFGWTDSEHGFSVQQTSDGGYIIAGFTTSYGAGSYDVYLIKTDPNGNKKWQKTFGGSDSDYGFSVQQTSDGGYIIAGDTGPYGSILYDVYIIKTNSAGIMQWQKTFGGSDEDSGFSVQQTSDGGYIIAGLTKSYGTGQRDVYLIKLCPDGTLSADFNCNGTVYYEDLDIMAGQWLQPPGILSADIAPEPGDGIVNGFDFVVFANDWLQTTSP